ncbi:bacteriohopanetetrol glucosamine biosynthesis glycosyltransferase HpnI [Leptolyngbya sp. FACHB-261]|uniref:bacteriohopanetetrol glucosamine biosynthesis glycosyltransferase HpnI n=1 Tax=Leptolyngbya sp. FACHB-261 TaxID=2692806 RepID=UPI00168594BE|nr:bacteriohopanetetrol glucosamine biosynthesis glycosyltransferase HpnI [Leptolyngbya sp. FACHB-261]MBD2101924.1 bacteriohopanetetrol glucosamine biosynthesis glycosyltransferase HpnI [Leptolyngbya sp. FACHB-261]
MTGYNTLTKDTAYYVPLLIWCLSAIWYYCYGIYAAITFAARPKKLVSGFHPPVTILKPICGLDNETYENFASFCRQDYPQYQIVFGVHNPGDPSVAVVKQIINDFPEIDVQLVVSDRLIGTNLKVSNLANAEAVAKYAILLLADSDVRVGPDYLKRVIQPLSNPVVGVVTCLYRPRTQGWVATLEAVRISTEYLTGVLVANQLEGIKFALGPTIAIRKSALVAVGGFVAIADYLADDYQLGNLPAQAGYKVVLSDYVIEHFITSERPSDLIHRQIRWAFCTRVSRPWGYLALLFTHGTVASLLLLLATSGSVLAWVALSATWTTRLAMAWIVGARCLNDPVTKKFLWLVPLCDLISFALWCYSFSVNTIEWRGHRFKLKKDGKLVLLKPNLPNPALRTA